jgi:glycosyltransferase involved in cell wall biosynthesis
MSIDQIPPALRQAFSNKEVVLFIGAGMSVAAGLPTARDLAKTLAAKMSIKGSPAVDDLEAMAENIVATYDARTLANELRGLLRTTSELNLSPSHFLIASLVKHGFVSNIITTNYDDLIEDACRHIGAEIDVVVTQTHLQLVPEGRPKLIKLHGDFDHPELLVISRNDYAKFDSDPRRGPLLREVQALAVRRSFLFLGYSLQDHNFLQLLTRVRCDADPKLLSRSFAAIYNPSELDQRRNELGQYDITAFPVPNPSEFLYDIISRLPVRLRVAHLLFQYPDWYPHPHVQYGGIETFLGYLYRAQASRHRHEILSVFDRSMYQAKAEQFKPRDLLYPASFYFFRSAVAGTLEELRERRRTGKDVPDVIHAHFLAFAEQAVEAGFPTVCTSHSLLSIDLAFTRGVFDGTETQNTLTELHELRKTEQQACLSLDHITVVSNFHKEELEHLGARGVEVLTAPFKGDQFCPPPEDRKTPSQTREELGLKALLTVTFVGRPDRRKGIEVLVDACTILQREKRNFQLLIVASGFEDRRSDSSSASDPVHFLSFALNRFKVDMTAFTAAGGQYTISPASYKPDVALRYAASDIVVVPSLYEPMGYVVLEAMASGKAIVASQTGGIPELLTHEETGLLFPPGDVEKLVAYLRTLMDKPQLREKLGVAAREVFSRRESLAESVARFDDLYIRAALAQALPISHQLPADTLAKIDGLCEDYAGRFQAFTIHAAAAVACQIAAQVGSEVRQDKSRPPPR